MSVRLSVSVVTYAPHITRLGDTLQSLFQSLAKASASGRLAEADVVLVDNGPAREWTERLNEMARCFDARLVSGHGNVGYGRGHNLVLLASRAEFHLVLNPDVIIDEFAIDEALRFMMEYPQVVILAPVVRGAKGQLQFLCRRYPSVFDFALRGFAPERVQHKFEARLAHYEMRELPLDKPTLGVPLLSGSFMFCRRAPIADVGGFSESFFVYFEDYDLSLRASMKGVLAFVPQVKVTHYGGNAARKGWRHIALFVHGALVFFRRHGWRWW